MCLRHTCGRSAWLLQEVLPVPWKIPPVTPSKWHLSARPALAWQGCLRVQSAGLRPGRFQLCGAVLMVMACHGCAPESEPCAAAAASRCCLSVSARSCAPDHLPPYLIAWTTRPEQEPTSYTAARQSPRAGLLDLHANLLLTNSSALFEDRLRLLAPDATTATNTPSSLASLASLARLARPQSWKVYEGSSSETNLAWFVDSTAWQLLY